MYTDEICAEAAALSGISEGVLAVCAAAAETGLTRRLREGILPGDIEDAFIAAASLMTLSIYYAADGGTSWSTGAVSMSKSGSDAPAALLRQAEAILCGYIEDGGFGFLGVDA